MTTWITLTCPVCGWRHTLKKFNSTMNPILYPAQIVTGGGRARGFKVAEYLPWSALPQLNRTYVGSSIRSLYSRLAAAYDRFYEVLGFMSPKMRMLLQVHQRSYANSYRTTYLDNYAKAFNLDSSPAITESYDEDDYSKAYSHLLIKLTSGDANLG